MNNTHSNTWYSGDWKPQNNEEVPYNGIKIAATANYTPPTSPPSTQKFVSLDVIVTDYTKAPNGVSSSVTLQKKGVWYNIPIPENTEVSPPEPNSDFTIGSLNNANLEELLQLAVTTTGTYLNLQFRYGIHSYKEELGFVMAISDTYTEGQDPIRVSG